MGKFTFLYRDSLLNTISIRITCKKNLCNTNKTFVSCKNFMSNVKKRSACLNGVFVQNYCVTSLSKFYLTISRVTMPYRNQ